MNNTYIGAECIQTVHTLGDLEPQGDGLWGISSLLQFETREQEQTTDTMPTSICVYSLCLYL